MPKASRKLLGFLLRQTIHGVLRPLPSLHKGENPPTPASPWGRQKQRGSSPSVCPPLHARTQRYGRTRSQALPHLPPSPPKGWYSGWNCRHRSAAGIRTRDMAGRGGLSHGVMARYLHTTYVLAAWSRERVAGDGFILYLIRRTSAIPTSSRSKPAAVVACFGERTENYNVQFAAHVSCRTCPYILDPIVSVWGKIRGRAFA